MAVVTNNSELSLSTIGEGVSALSCHTELTTCCRDQDSPTGEALGDWVGPDGSSLPETSDNGFYVTREMSSVSLNLVEGSSVSAGSYCCQVPRSGGGISTHCIMVAGEDWCKNLHFILFINLSCLATTSTSILGPIIGGVVGVILAVLLIVIIIVLVMLFLR